MYINPVLFDEYFRVVFEKAILYVDVQVVPG